MMFTVLLANMYQRSQTSFDSAVKAAKPGDLFTADLAVIVCREN